MYGIHRKLPLKSTLISLLLLALFTFAACSSKSGEKVKMDNSSTSSGNATELTPIADATATADWETDSEAGITWKAPPTWTVGPERPMRAATYFAGPTEAPQAECRVNFFGADQGGDVKSNIDRWVSQMEAGDNGEKPEPMLAEAEQNGITLNILELHGTYMERMRPMDPDATARPDYVMFAVIAQGPGGSVFYKMTGPEKVMDAERDNFRKMLGTIGGSSM